MLLYAALKNELALIKLLINLGAPVDYNKLILSDNLTVIEAACISHETTIDTLKYLISIAIEQGFDCKE